MLSRLVVKRLLYITVCASNSATFWNQRFWCGTLFLHINDETRTLQAWSSMHSIKKAGFLLWANWIYLTRSRVSPPFPLHLKLLFIVVCNFYQAFLNDKMEWITILRVLMFFGFLYTNVTPKQDTSASYME